MVAVGTAHVEQTINALAIRELTAIRLGPTVIALAGPVQRMIKILFSFPKVDVLILGQLHGLGLL